MKKVISIFPFDVDSNQYILNHKNIFKKLGYELEAPPRNLNAIKILLSDYNAKKKTIVLNWFEDISSSKGLFFWLYNIVWLLCIRLLYNKVIFVQHNIKPHSGLNVGLFYCSQKLLKFFCDDYVTHISQENSTYIPHPMYNEDPSKFKIKKSNTVKYLIFGQVKSYKGIDEVLRWWPTENTLTIAGKCTDKVLENKIVELIRSRELNVNFINKFLNDVELEEIVLDHNVVIIPNKNESMLVSGAFYYAAGLGCNILMRNGQFFDDCSTKYKFVFELSSYHLENDLSLVPRNDVFQQLYNECNTLEIGKRWKSIIE